MAFRCMTIGLPNSGKSYSWRNYKGGDVFAICPSAKIVHIRDKDGNLPKPFDIAVKGKGDNLEELMARTNAPSPHHIVSFIIANQVDPADVRITGDYAMCSAVGFVGDYKRLVSRYMPDKNILLTPDFTHFLSYIIQSRQFQSRKAGGEAFARFWELAGDTLREVFLSSDELRHDMLDITEFHAKFDEDLQQFSVFTPAGKMLTDKFLPESYFDIALSTYVLPWEEEKVSSKRFKFVVVPKGPHQGRSIGLFDDIEEVQMHGYMPNDWGMVVERLRAYLGH